MLNCHAPWGLTTSPRNPSLGSRYVHGVTEVLLRQSQATLVLGGLTTLPRSPRLVSRQGHGISEVLGMQGGTAVTWGGGRYDLQQKSQLGFQTGTWTQ